MTRRIKAYDAGFTLIELSIVLIVIGLIIGSVLIAVNIIQNARVTTTVNAIQGYQAAVSTYVQNFGALPGDDTKAIDRFTANGVTNKGGGDGIIGLATLTKTFDSTAALADGNGASESRLVWSHLRAAGLVKGAGSDATQPANPFNGLYGIQYGAFTTGLTANVICLSNVPGSAARIIDQRLDDGVASTGNARSGASVTGAAATDYVDATLYTQCINLQ